MSNVISVQIHPLPLNFPKEFVMGLRVIHHSRTVSAAGDLLE